MSEEILPCPHCGGSDIRFDSHGIVRNRFNYEHYGDGIWSMCCYNCGATFPNMYNKEGLVTKWNRRVLNPDKP